MKADMEAMKEQMATMMEAMMSMKKIMEANAVAVSATSAVAKVNPMPPSGLNQINHPIPDMVGLEGKELGGTGGPHLVRKTSMPSRHMPCLLIIHHRLILIESQQPQSNHAHVSQPMGETHEMPHHNLADFEPCLGYATEGQAVGGIPLQNTLEGPQYHPQPHPLHSTWQKWESWII